MFRSEATNTRMGSGSAQIQDERLGMTYRLLFTYAFVRLESEQNSSHPTFPRASQSRRSRRAIRVMNSRLLIQSIRDLIRARIALY